MTRQKITEQGIYDYYENIFKKIYGDMVVIVGDKPKQIAFELEAVLSHLAVAHINRSDTHIFQKNIDRAYGHLERAALDSAKIMWRECQKRAKRVIEDQDTRDFASNVSEPKLLQMFQQAESIALEVRGKDLANVGIDQKEAIIVGYHQAALLFRDIVEKIDPDKQRKLKKRLHQRVTKERCIDFIIGASSSALVVALVTWLF